MKRSRESGQSTIEFALVLMLLMGFILFYLQLSLVMGFGNYVHYATFMSARAYMAAGSSKADQTARAREVIASMVKRPNSPGTDRFPSIAKGESQGDGDVKGFTSSDHEKFNALDTSLSWMQGVRYTFKSRLFLIPLGREGGNRGNSSGGNGIILQSESWLGREPSYDECKQEMGRIKGIFDNGC